MTQKYEVILTEQFDFHLRGIVLYIHECSPLNAETFVEEVIQEIEGLKLFPQRSVEVLQGIYLKVFKGYWIVYKVEGTQVFILDFINPRQDSRAKKYYNQ